MDQLKAEYVKTIKRLGQQQKHEVLKNKIKTWIQENGLTVDTIVSNIRQKNVEIHHSVLNQLGNLYGSGREGFTEDQHTAFSLYEVASEIGNPSAAGSCAQYFFDGRAPGGRNIDKAQRFCHRALTLGGEKFNLLMAEILFFKREYAQAVHFIGKIHDKKKKADSRALEKECLFKALDGVYNIRHVHYFVAADSSVQQTTVQAADDNEEDEDALRSRAAPHQQNTFSSAKKINDRTASAGILNKGPPSPSLSNSRDFSRMVITSDRHSYVSPHGRSNEFNLSIHNSSHNRTLNGFNTNVVAQLPGWFSITDELDGFDSSCCNSLTARAKVLEMEAQSIKVAMETAEQHIANARNNQFSAEIVNALVRTKVSEFETLYHKLEANKIASLTSWEDYIDTDEHVLRRQVLTEKRFFNVCGIPAGECAAVHALAVELLKRRLNHDVASVTAVMTSSGAGVGPNGRHSNESSDPIVLQQFGAQPYRLPCARNIIAAERSVVETSHNIYGRTKSENATQKTGWTVAVSLLDHHPSDSGNKKKSSSGGDGSGSPIPLPHTNQDVYTHTECLVLAADSLVQYKHRVTPQRSVLDGDYVMEGPYMDTADTLRVLTAMTTVPGDDHIGSYSAQNVCRMAELFIRFLKDGVATSLQELQALNEDASIDDVCTFNRICYHLFVKRLVRWVLPYDPKLNKLELPVASVTARALQLLRLGHLSLVELFSPESLFSVLQMEATSGTIHILRDKLIQINTLYQRAVSEQTADNHISAINFWKHHRHGRTVPTYQLLRSELAATFGGSTELVADEPTGLGKSIEPATGGGTGGVHGDEEARRHLLFLESGGGFGEGVYGSEDHVCAALHDDMTSAIFGRHST